jgi:hypothetical protein
VSGSTQVPALLESLFVYGAITLYGPTFQSCFTKFF